MAGHWPELRDPLPEELGLSRSEPLFAPPPVAGPAPSVAPLPVLPPDVPTPLLPPPVPEPPPCFARDPAVIPAPLVGVAEFPAPIGGVNWPWLVVPELLPDPMLLTRALSVPPLPVPTLSEPLLGPPLLL